MNESHLEELIEALIDKAKSVQTRSKNRKVTIEALIQAIIISANTGLVTPEMLVQMLALSIVKLSEK